MTSYHITNGHGVGAKLMDRKTYASRDEAIASLIAPRWAGDAEAAAEFVAEHTMVVRREVYNLVPGENPRATLAAAKAEAPRSSIAAAYRKGAYYGSRALTRDMDRADSDN